MLNQPSRSDFAAFKKNIIENAPTAATQYALAWPVPGSLLVQWTPLLTVRTKRFDGGLVVGRYFMLRPRFELPRVAHTGLHAIAFYDDSGKEIENPVAMICGVWVPAAFRTRNKKPLAPKPSPVTPTPSMGSGIVMKLR